MICYRCGTDVGNEKKCPECGENLEILQRVRKISNSLYNDGYYKAQVRDLSGAAACLESSLKYNKYNTNARNLLGLVYYEIGETVNALSEWVISASLQPENNQAVRYLKYMKETNGLMEKMKQTTRKYNQAVYYCSVHSNDLALVQLKKVIALSPNMLKAHQLMGLLYLQNGDLENARKSLKEAGKIDSANTDTFRYMKEVNRKIRLQTGKPETQEEELVTYQNGNETVIMPKRIRERSLGSMIRCMVVGLVIGVAAAVWIFTPAAVAKVKDQMQEKVAEASSASSSSSQQISSLQAQIDAMQGTIDSSSADQGQYESKATSYENLLYAYIAYLGKDKATSVTPLCEVDPSVLEGDAVGIYQTISTDKEIRDAYLKGLYDDGNKAFSAKDYDSCISYLSALFNQEPNYQNGSAAYALAMAYRYKADSVNARTYFQYVVDNDKDTDLATQASGMIQEIAAEDAASSTTAAGSTSSGVTKDAADAADTADSSSQGAVTKQAN